jgi:DNA processing protein
MSTDPASAALSTTPAETADPELEQVRRARVWLARAAEPGSAAVVCYVARYGPVEAVRRIRSGQAPPAVTSCAAGRIADDLVDADLAVAVRGGIRPLIPEDPDWPAAAFLPMEAATARGVPDLAPPLMLWVCGSLRLDELADRAVAIVGARTATAYGQHVAADLAYRLSAQGWTVVSGGAFGIDAAAHRGALSAESPTIAVIAGGLQAPYPSGNARLFERIADLGLLLSEWPPDCRPQRHRFLIRNRLIAGLVAGTVVVEAGARSGSRHTARRSRELGRPVMVVPGPVTSAMSVGTHQMARESGARLVTNAAEVLEEVGRLGADLAPRPQGPTALEDTLDEVSRRVLDGVPVREPSAPESVAREAGVELTAVLRCLPALEVLGLVRCVRGGWQLTESGRWRGRAR